VTMDRDVIPSGPAGATYVAEEMADTLATCIDAFRVHGATDSECREFRSTVRALRWYAQRVRGRLAAGYGASPHGDESRGTRGSPAS